MEVNLCNVSEVLLSSCKIFNLKGTIFSQMVEKKQPKFSDFNKLLYVYASVLFLINYYFQSKEPVGINVIE
jgi:hypothetical protein